MSDPDASATNNATMKTLRFHSYGEAAEVLRLEKAAIPDPGPRRIRVLVHACGLNPADWALCQGLFAGDLPRGIGIEVSGRVDAVGEGVNDAAPGDLVLGTADWANCASAGASEYALMDHWTLVPEGLDLVDAAALPMAVETSVRSLDLLGVAAGQTLLIYGAGTMMGYAAVQIALMRGARVIAAAGETFAERLRTLGATVTPYGDGMVDRVLEIAGGTPELILDAAPPSGVLPDLVKIAGGDPRCVLTITDFAAAKELGVRNSFEETTDLRYRYDVLGEYARLAAAGRFTVPVARTFSLGEWREALEVSQSRRAHGKLVLLPGHAAAAT